MYWTRSRELSMAKEVSPAAALMTSFIAAAILLPASMLISCALAAISATVSRTSAPRWPGWRRTGGVVTAAAVASAATGLATAGVLSGIRSRSVHEQDAARVAASHRWSRGSVDCTTKIRFHEKPREVIGGKYMEITRPKGCR